ncbi:MAG: acyl-CoA thioesterase [Hellea sp.]|nr:acyl-CoA thioesterase [Hellea sp.]
MRPAPEPRSAYKHFQAMPTRWADNDVYGHVNNSVYYFFFDTLINEWLINQGLLEIGKSETVGLVVGTSCNFFAPITFPDVIYGGLRVAKIGSSSVTYEIGLFKNDEAECAAKGHFVHVYVNEKTRRPAKLSDDMRRKLEALTG